MSMISPTRGRPITTIKTMNRMRTEEALWAWLFILPSVLGMMTFTIIPIIASFVLSVYSWDFLTPPVYVGPANFQRLSTDTRLLTGFSVTAVYVVAHVVLTTLLGLVLALAVTRKISTILRSILRAAYFFPVIVSTASVAIIWTYLYNTDLGIINYYIKQLGGEAIPWLSASRWALWSVIIMSVWKSVGFNFVLLVAGLQNIPKEYYEAAEIDGANAWKRFLFITIPLLSPTVLFILVMGLIGSFQVFDAPYIMTTGGPGDATRTVGIFIYEHGMRFLRMGYASTIALALFSIIMVLTIIQFTLSKKWVVY